MNKFYCKKTCTTNLKEFFPEEYIHITRHTIVNMLITEGYMNEVHVIQISTCHRFTSICFDTRENLLTFTNTEHSLLDIHITFYPNYYERRRISIENLPIELQDKEVKTFLSEYVTLIGKTNYPGIKSQNKYFTTGTRIYQCTTILKHIPKHIHYFGRYLRIRYNEQAEHDTDFIQQQQPQTQQPEQDTVLQLDPDTTEPELPRNMTFIQCEQSQTLPLCTPTPHLFDTSNMLDKQQPEVEEEHQETPQHKANSKQKQNQNQRPYKTKKHSKTIIKWWINTTKINNVNKHRYSLDTGTLLETISDKDRQRVFQEVIDGKFKYRLRRDYDEAR